MKNKKITDFCSERKNWFYGALACLALMVSLNADLSAIGEEAAPVKIPDSVP